MKNEKRLIDANALYNEIEEEYDLYYGEIVTNPRRFAEMVEDAPTVDAVEVVHGRWISYLDGDSIMPERYYRCSECCDRGWRRKWPYCPNCGAKMDGDGNE